MPPRAPSHLPPSATAAAARNGAGPVPTRLQAWLARLPRSVRFVLTGGLNTGLTYGLYLVLLAPLGYRWAYGLAFVAGIALSYAMLRWLVFRAPGRRHAWALVAATQLGQFVVGLAVVELWVAVLGWPSSLAALASVAVCVPLTYAVHRWVFRAGVA
ncbi:hypothetical protein CCO03_17960 [Comamonas serinivorans]|uniref:GtrA/DPMS transmembrane domain-containing protein n=1 Tax=Comamonas serinivorans TaxID=1082851 RepID=A0A1Y0ESN8_9BURK|nr:GtrA family protein [Comamonas serinivorans]ARU06309.1 hypothetical protein CCO03_17960 [Comamonas serinivorans]